MIPYYAIYVKESEISLSGLKVLQASTKEKIIGYKSINANEVDLFTVLNKYALQWNYPWEDEFYDFKIGLKKTPYPTKNKNARISCALSHYLLWKNCKLINMPVVILEHDAVFLKEIDFNINDTGFDIIGLNDPRGATRRSALYHKKIQEKKNKKFISVPTIDDIYVPQGLAGNSAYIMTPVGATEMIKLVQKHGLWPNDAIMCKQLLTECKIGVSTTYYTKVQGLRSTTST